jgi:OCT family organic cation transporter-like MFS transporter 4/5
MVLVGAVLLFWVPESPRWLIARSRTDEAKKILLQAARTNGKDIQESDIVLKKPNANAAQGSFLDIMRHPTLRLQVLIMYFNWFTTAFIMYGLALSWQNLTGGLFLNFLIGTILDFPAKSLALILVLKCGRKYPYMIASAITGVMFLCTLFIERDVYPSNWPIVVFALIGNFSTTLCFAILYMYTGELMPTTVRAAGVGSSSLVSKVGGTLSTTVAALADIHPAIPTIIFVSLAIASAGLTWFLPETMGRKMPETINDVENTGLCAKKREGTNATELR